MTCRDFEQWLDEGMPEGKAAAARAHAAACVACASMLAAAREIEVLLAGTPASAPPLFTDHVMARVATAGTLRARERDPAPAPSILPWWVRAAYDPAAVLAAATAALVAWRIEELIRLPEALAAGIVPWTGGLARLSALMSPAGQISSGAPGADPMVKLALLVAAVTLLAVGSVPLYRWCERIAEGPIHREIVVR